jgi:proteasome lid subunit RPN8/RPN11
MRFRYWLGWVLTLGAFGAKAQESLTYVFEKATTSAPLEISYYKVGQPEQVLTGNQLTARYRPGSNNTLTLRVRLQAPEEQRTLLEMRAQPAWATTKAPGLVLQTCECDVFTCELTYAVTAETDTEGRLKIGLATEELGEAPPSRPRKTITLTYQLQLSSPVAEPVVEKSAEPGPDQRQTLAPDTSPKTAVVDRRVATTHADSLPAEPEPAPHTPDNTWLNWMPLAGAGAAGLLLLAGLLVWGLKYQQKRARRPKGEVKVDNQRDQPAPEPPSTPAGLANERAVVLSPSANPVANYFYEIFVGNERPYYAPINLDHTWADTAVALVFLKQAAALAMRDLIQHTTANYLGFVPKTGGFLLGKYYYEPYSRRYVVSVEAITTVTPSDKNPRKLVLDTSAWLALNAALQGSGQVVVGWFHTQPEGNLHLTPSDWAIHDGFFRQPYQLLMQVDISKAKWSAALFSRRATNALNNTTDRRGEWVSWHEVLSGIA